MSQKKIKLSELDFNNIGNWPQNAKIGFCVLVTLLILFLLLGAPEQRPFGHGAHQQFKQFRVHDGSLKWNAMIVRPAAHPEPAGSPAAGSA